MAPARRGSQAEAPLVACTPQEAAALPVREAAVAPGGRQFPEQLAGLRAEVEAAHLRTSRDFRPELSRG